jgi:hypothetical protein
LVEHAKREKMRKFYRKNPEDHRGWAITPDQLSEVARKLREKDNYTVDMETIEDLVFVLEDLGYLVVEDF